MVANHGVLRSRYFLYVELYIPTYIGKWMVYHAWWQLGVNSTT